VRQADYIYGIVPERGEYGFEVLPAQGDPATLARVQTLASSFQWNATTSEDVVAIAVDRSHPPLIARIATDPRDPNGRISICMEIWITSATETLEQMIAEVWPGSVRLPNTQEDFLSIALQKNSGRIVVGPKASFSAVGFDSSLGVSSVMPDFANITGNLKSTARQNLSTTNRANQSKRKLSSLLSSPLLKVLSTLLFFALLATVWYAVSQTLEVEKLRAITKSLNEDAMELKRQINDKAKAMQQKTIENERKSRELEESRSKSQELERQVSELQRALAASPGKEDQAILLSLRNAVNSYIDTQKLSLQALKDAVSPVPQSPTRPKE
jgi:Skp family chaperone for outer membrane proteins